MGTIIELMQLLLPAVVAVFAVLYQVERNARINAEKKLSELRSKEYEKIFETLFELQDEMTGAKGALSPERFLYFQEQIFRVAKRRLMFWSGEEVFFAYLDLLDWWSGKTRSEAAHKDGIIFAREFLQLHADLVIAMPKELGSGDKKISRNVIMERVFGDHDNYKPVPLKGRPPQYDSAPPS